ncbi:39S ribosomal protein L46 mitochondrial [Taenia crassiceps]|uniref:39S ribosomal protein L46 mitochondrial n=1 Tax=Taenia crassiceps TaxID=6207 RepID=A0ABR4QQB6_9CEST
MPCVSEACGKSSPGSRQVQEFFAELEVQRSHLSAHEVRHRNDLEHMAKMAKEQQEGKQGASRHQTSRDGATASLLTAKDMELIWEAEAKEFWKELGSASQYEAGEGNETDVTSKATAWRKLDRVLILLTRQRLGKFFDWGLPVVEVSGTSTLRSAAEDLARALLPPEAQCMIVGNAPVAMHKYAYRIDEGKKKGQKQGVQMYFLNAYVNKLWHGENIRAEEAPDGRGAEANFAWTCIEEMDDFITNKQFLRRLRTFIVDY